MNDDASWRSFSAALSTEPANFGAPKTAAKEMLIFKMFQVYVLCARWGMWGRLIIGE